MHWSCTAASPLHHWAGTGAARTLDYDRLHSAQRARRRLCQGSSGPRSTDGARREPGTEPLVGRAPVMNTVRVTAAQQINVADRVTMTDGQRTFVGHVARKGRTHATVVTDDGRELRVPYSLLSRMAGA